jgi:hypothetical protein
MLFAEIVNSLVATSFILAIVAIIYFLFVIVHPYSQSAKAAIESQLNGCLVEAFVWFVLTLFALFLYSNRDFQLANVLGQVVGANFLNVTIIALSFVIVPTTFSIYDACSRFDYRIYAIGGFIAIGLIVGMVYLML